MLALHNLVVVSEMDMQDSVARTFHAVHSSYFGKMRPACPRCQSEKTTETKIRPRKFKDILPSGDGKQNVIDLIFHQRFFRCKDCGRVFHEDIDFAEEGCRYTNRLSDLLAEGTLTQTYEKVCKKYSVPASKTSVGIIMRRRLRLKTEQLPPLETPESLSIFVAYYHSCTYPVVLGIYGKSVRLIDILSESSVASYATFFNGLEKGTVRNVYIDPDEQLHSAVMDAFPKAKIMVSEECVKRYIFDAFKDVIRKEGPRCFIQCRYDTLSKKEAYLENDERRQVEKTMKRRHRLSAAYNAYQDVISSMSTKWDIEKINGWVDDLPDYLADKADEGEKLEPLREFDVVKEITNHYKQPINEFLSLKEKPPDALGAAVKGIVEALEELPYCIYDVLHARMLLNVEHKIQSKNGKQYRSGIPIKVLAKRIQDISDIIKSDKENDDDEHE